VTMVAVVCKVLYQYGSVEICKYVFLFRAHERSSSCTWFHFSVSSRGVYSLLLMCSSI
jgi:hypothetical protein